MLAPGARLLLSLQPGGHKRAAAVLLEPGEASVIYDGPALTGTLPQAFEWTGQGVATLLVVLSDEPVDAKRDPLGQRRPPRRRRPHGDAAPMTRARALCAAALLAALPALAEARRFALVVGDANGGAGTRPLRYAERDARRMHAILTRLGGVRPEDARLLTSASAAEVRAALADLSARAGQAKARGDETVLLVYYSGHAKDGDLRLGDSGMPLARAARRFAQARPADVRIGLLDSCQSGAITRSKGVRAAPGVRRAAGAGRFHAARAGWC